MNSKPGFRENSKPGFEFEESKPKNILPGPALIKIIPPFLVFIFLLSLFLISAPADFPANKIIIVEKGLTSKQVAENFEKENLVRYAVLFDTLVRYSGREKDIKAGKYLFDKKLSLFGLMRRLINAEYGVPDIKITIPEGFSIKDINRIFTDKGFENFEIKDKELEGYLFPDTYFFSVDSMPQDVVAKMMENLKSKITPDLEKAFAENGRNFHKILTMASILEKEAATAEDRKIISGILWKRLDKKMPLQVDAAFLYFIDKNTFQLTDDDLKIDSPYNTYLYRGLPPMPIANPGLDAILAAIYPKKSPYWYYLSDKDGIVYYSETYDDHLTKKAKYLR